MVHADRADPLAAVERVEQVRNHSTGHLEHTLHATAFEITHDVIGDLDLHCAETRSVARRCDTVAKGCALYQSTVLIKPSSSLTCGDHPVACRSRSMRVRNRMTWS